MKILHTVQLYSPVIGGSEMAVQQISERLAVRGHEVTVATAWHPGRSGECINGVRLAQFKVSGNLARGLRGEVERYRRFVRELHAEVMMNYAAQAWSTDALLADLETLPGRKVIVPCGYSALLDPAYGEYFAALPRYLAQYDHIVYLSSGYRDALYGAQHGLRRFTVIPNGADEGEFNRPRLGFRERFGITTRYLIITVANHYRSKGHAFVIRALGVMSCKDVTLAIIGEAPGNPLRGCSLRCAVSRLCEPRIRLFRGLPRQWVVSALQEADLFLFGSRVECAPVVMYESFAAGTPMIARPAGNIEEHGDLVRVVDTPQAMAAAADELLRDSPARQGVAEAGRRRWRETYTWAGVTDRYEALYRELCNGRA